MSNKGSILIELLLVLLVMTVLELLFFPYYKINTFHHYYFLNNYQLNQLEAMKKGEKIILDNDISFNAKGNVNQAKTIEINNHNYVIGLGLGRIYEKR